MPRLVPLSLGLPRRRVSQNAAGARSECGMCLHENVLSEDALNGDDWNADLRCHLIYKWPAGTLPGQLDRGHSFI